MLGNKFTVFTDHRPLEGTFRKNLSEVMNPRLLSYRLKLVPYADMEVIWTEGKSHLIADALSRNPIFDPPESSGDQMALCYGVQPKDPLLHSIYDAAVADPVYQSIVTAIKRGKLVAKLQNWKKLQECLGQDFGFRRCDFGNKCYSNSSTNKITSSDPKTVT
jgi:hypothetical protein